MSIKEELSLDVEGGYLRLAIRGESDRVDRSKMTGNRSDLCRIDGMEDTRSELCRVCNSGGYSRNILTSHYKDLRFAEEI